MIDLAPPIPDEDSAVDRGDSRGPIFLVCDIQGKTCRRLLKIMQTIELELRSMGIWRDPFRGGDFQPQIEMFVLFSAYAKGGPSAYRNKLKKIRAKQARKLNLSQKKKKKAPQKKIKKAKGCPSCARLEQCCRQATDSTDIKICFAALRVLKSRCLERECKIMVRAWRADGRCR